MNHGKALLMMVICLIIVSLSAIAGADDNSQTDNMTFSAVGNSIGYSQDILNYVELTRDANTELMKFKVHNHNSPAKYNVTISESQHEQLKSAKERGEIKEIQIKTNQSVTVKEPVIENCTKLVCFQDYYDDATFERDLNNLEGKIFDTDVDVNVTDHVNPLNGADYKRISIYKTHHLVKSFNDRNEQITAHVVVNDMQADSKDWVFFHADSLGMDGNMAEGHIEI